MKQFPSSKYFSSWAGVCPGHNRSAGNNHGSRTPGGNPWLGSTLTECAWAAAAIKNSYLKEKFWRIVGRSAGQKAPALVAVAPSLLGRSMRCFAPVNPIRVATRRGCLRCRNNA